MPGRFDPASALEGSFLGFGFFIAREGGEGGRRGPLHQYPDRDEPYHEDLGEEARKFDLSIYFIGATADDDANDFIELLREGRIGPLILPGLRRERMKAVKWKYDREVGKARWTQLNVNFVDPGRNEYPGAIESWPHLLVDAALLARTAFAAGLALRLAIENLGQEVREALADAVASLADALDSAAQTAAGLAPSTAIAESILLTGAYAAEFVAASIDTAALAVETFDLVAGWADSLAGSTPDNASRQRAISALFDVYDAATQPFWYAEGAQSPLQLAELANQAAYSAAVRRSALTEAARLTASLDFASYDDAAALRDRFADAFDNEVDAAASEPEARSALVDLSATTLRAISEAGADKARLVPYKVAAVRPAFALSQLWYPADPDLPARARELRLRTGAVHPAFMPATGERLSS